MFGKHSAPKTSDLIYSIYELQQSRLKKHKPLLHKNFHYFQYFRAFSRVRTRSTVRVRRERNPRALGFEDAGTCIFCLKKHKLKSSAFKTGIRDIELNDCGYCS